MTNDIMDSEHVGAADFESVEDNPLAYALSDNPDDRYVCAIEGYCLELLAKDECWLVRHAAKRSLLREELENKGFYIREGCANENFPFSGISEIAYELYKADWISKNTTAESRRSFVLDWVVDCLRAQREGRVAQTYESWERNATYGGGIYLPYDDFIGFLQPNSVGLYHNREFIAELFENNKTLMSMYDADIHDGYYGKFKSLDIDSLLESAHGKAGNIQAGAETAVEQEDIER